MNNMTLYEKQQNRRRRRQTQIVARILTGILAVICVFACAAFLVSGKEYTPQEEKQILEAECSEPIIRGTPTELEAVDATRKGGSNTDDLLMKIERTRIKASDTPEEDKKDDEFELLCMVVMAEGGNTEPKKGIRYMADGILNRVDSDRYPDTIREVCYQTGPIQFNCVYDGSIYKWEMTERVIQICAEEMKSRMNKDVIYWKTHGYHKGTTPIEHVGHHYYSGF